MKQFFSNLFFLILELFSGPDGRMSSKRTSAWICLFVGIAIQVTAMVKPVDTTVYTVGLGTFMAGFFGALGITVIDGKSFFKAASHQPQVESNQPIGFTAYEGPIIMPSDDNEIEEDKLKARKRKIGFH